MSFGREEARKRGKEKNWHVIERSYGSFRRAVTLPFEPKQESVSAHFEKGVLHIEVAKPATAQSAAKTIEIKSGDGGAKKAPQDKAA